MCESEETQIKTDCFGYGGVSAKQPCRVCNELLCEKGSCPFYKTWAQYESGLKKYPWKDMYAEKSNLKGMHAK